MIAYPMGNMPIIPLLVVQICEDSAEELNSEELGRPLNQLVPMLLALFSHPKDSFRVTALKCMNHLIQLSPQALLLNMDAYLQVRGKRKLFSQCRFSSASGGRRFLSENMVHQIQKKIVLHVFLAFSQL